MNTKDKQDQKKNQQQKTRQKPLRKKQGHNRNAVQEHEHPEMRLTR